jgi:ABC-type glycerol-3-phosphate transport system substrate-binding protein
MSKKKMIFLSILWVVVFTIIVVIMVMTSNSKKNSIWTKKVSNNFKIWILNDSKDNFSSFIEDFKNFSWNKNFSATIESFNDYEEYNKTLASAIIKWEAPDLYMLNNNEKSIFLESATWIDPNIISPDEIRSYFKPFFWDDLILSSDDDEKTEFLLWVPFWFETLGLYYNRKVWDIKKLTSFTKMQQLIEDKKESNPWIVFLWIGRWNTVENSEDIITQFIMSRWVSNISSINSQDIKSAFSEYFDYASWENGYIKAENRLYKSSRTNLDYFADWKIYTIFGYPSMLEKISNIGFSKWLLWVVNFPEFINEWNTLVNYNYFVLNKDSQNKEVAYDFLKYLFSEEWEKAYLKHFKNYIPARLSVYSELKDRKINDNFNVKLKNFYNSEANYSSFDKWLKWIYDKEIIEFLDNEAWYLEKMLKFWLKMKCKVSKIIKLENLSKTCG